MKPSRLNKVIGLSLGEQSLLAAEVVAPADKGGRPEVRQFAEFRYPDGVTPANPAELGTALAAFLRDQKFTARHAVVGLPAKWLIVKPKAVPPADPATLAELLRLQAEGEFSSELKDLTYDYAADATAGHPTSVLLLATPQRYVDAAVAMCDAAKLTAAAVTPSAVALGSATAAEANGTSSIVMAVGPAGAELTAQVGQAPAAIRHFRTPAGGGAVGDDKPFLGELRRAVSTLPVAAAGSARQMVLWGTPADAAALGVSLGIPVRAGELSSLGVDPNGTAASGDGRRYAGAVAVALSAMTDGGPAVDFLHSRLAPPPVRRVPRWVVTAALAIIAVVAAAVWANSYLQERQAKLDALTKQVDGQAPAETQAQAFVKMVSFAKRWHGGDARYLACLRDLTVALPQDNETYATNLTLHEPPRPTGAAAAAAAKADDPTLVGRLEGVTSDQVRAQQVVDRLKALPAFKDVHPGGSTGKVSNRTVEVAFSVTFNYLPPKAKPPAAAAPSVPHK